MDLIYILYKDMQIIGQHYYKFFLQLLLQARLPDFFMAVLHMHRFLWEQR